MSKRQLQQQQQQQQPSILNDLQLSELVEHDENPNLFEHLVEDFQDMMSDKQVLRNCVEKFIENSVDEFTLGIIFDIHRKCKTNAYCLEVEDNGEEEESNKTEVFQQISVKNNQKCVCPNCERTVAPLRFARHLATCMGVSETSRSSRNASRRSVTNREKGDTSAYAGVHSDDDDDEEWNARRNSKKKDKNGGKKNRGTPKKNLEQEAMEPINVDIEGNYDEVTNLRYMTDQNRRSYVMDLHERRSNSASPTDGAGGSTTPKKREKAKKKLKSKDGGSPSTSLSFE